VKNHNRYCEKSQEINIIDKDKIKIINNNELLSYLPLNEAKP
jgi:hypothetical protein